jgi:hypothetical protein
VLEKILRHEQLGREVIRLDFFCIAVLWQRI